MNKKYDQKRYKKVQKNIIKWYKKSCNPKLLNKN